MAPAVRFPGKNSKRMECATSKGSAGSPPSEWLWVTLSFWSTALYLFYVGLRIFAVMDPKFVHAHPDVLNSLTLRACQPSILHSPTPKGKICLFTFPSRGCGLISSKICSTWTQMTVNGSCGTLHTVCRAVGMACSPAVNARCLPFCAIHWLTCQTAPIEGNLFFFHSQMSAWGWPMNTSFFKKNKKQN